MSLCLLCLPDTCLTSHSESNRRTPAAGRRHGGPDIAVEGEWIRNDQMLWRFHNVWIKLLERRELRSQVAFHHRADRNQSDWPSWSFSDWLLKWQNELWEEARGFLTLVNDFTVKQKVLSELVIWIWLIYHVMTAARWTLHPSLNDVKSFIHSCVDMLDVQMHFYVFT